MSMPRSDVFIASRMLADPVATKQLGDAIARAALPGLIVLLDGPLGAGKTTLVQGFAAGIGAAQSAASPSFVLAHNYLGGRLPVWHLDLYRLENEAEIDDLDLDLYMPLDGVALVEWAERARDRWPVDHLRIKLEVAGSGRVATIECADVAPHTAMHAFKAIEQAG